MIPDPFKPYLYGALAIATMLFIWWGVSTVQKAALYEEAQAEIGMANDTIESLVNEHVAQQEKFNEEAKKRHEIALKAERLERRYAGIAAAGDAAAFNVELCAILEGIQGSPFGEAGDDPGSACHEAARGGPYYTLTKEGGATLLTILSRVRDQQEQLEPLRH